MVDIDPRIKRRVLRGRVKAGMHVRRSWYFRHPLKALVYGFILRATKRGVEGLRCIGATEVYNPQTATTYSLYGISARVIEHAFPRLAKM